MSKIFWFYRTRYVKSSRIREEKTGYEGVVGVHRLLFIKEETCRRLKIASNKVLIAFLAVTFYSKFGRAKFLLFNLVQLKNQ